MKEMHIIHDQAPFIDKDICNAIVGPTGVTVNIISLKWRLRGHYLPLQKCFPHYY